MRCVERDHGVSLDDSLGRMQLTINMLIPGRPARHPSLDEFPTPFFNMGVVIIRSSGKQSQQKVTIPNTKMVSRDTQPA